MQRRLRSISAKVVSVTLNYLTYFSIILALTMGPLYSTTSWSVRDSPLGVNLLTNS